MSVSRKALDRYESSHWGNGPSRVDQVPDPDLPRELVQMGELRSIRIRDGNSWLTLDFGTTGPGLAGDVIDLSTRNRNNRVAFTHDRAERLYFLTTDAARKRARASLVVPRAPWYLLNEVVRSSEGRQTRYPYPASVGSIPVQVLGKIWDIVYFTDKKGDGPNEYIHRSGEDSGKRPWLTIDESGRFWVAGGNYSVPDGGITD